MYPDFQKECAELATAAREFVERGGSIEQVFNREMLFVERERVTAGGTEGVFSVPKLGQDFHNLVAAFRAGTAERVADQIGVMGHGSVSRPVPENV
jgi:hypothetical protein